MDKPKAVRMGMAALSLAGLASVASCGGSNSDARVSGAIDAVSAIASFRPLWSAMTTDPANARSALAQLANVRAFLSILSTPAGQSSTTAQTEQAAEFPGCVSVTASQTGGTASFNNCTSGGVTLGGSASKDGDNYTANLQLNFSVAGFTGTVTYSGAIMVSPTQLGGMMTLSVNLNAQGQTYALNVTANFVNVSLCQAGTLTLPGGGSISVSGQGNAGGTNINKSVTVTFGPSCGTARVGA